MRTRDSAEIDIVIATCITGGIALIKFPIEQTYVHGEK